MKVQLIVVQGKPEGKVIPLVGPDVQDRARRDVPPAARIASRSVASTPSSSLAEDTVSVRDLGSRNGTLVNGKAIDRVVPAQGP